MRFDSLKSQSKILIPLLFIVGAILGIGMGILVGLNPLYPFLLVFVTASLLIFLGNFERTVIALLIIRTSLDVFSDYQLPAVFALGVIGLTILYVIIQLLTHQTVQTDKLWWCLMFWLILQGLWVILLPLGGLGFDGSYLSVAVREWIRLLSWLIIYLLILQLRGRIAPQKLISLLFLGIIIPLIVASLQIILPPSSLPELLVFHSESIEAGSRINGSLGHPNTFTTFIFMFMGLTYWKQNHAQNRKPWLILLGIIAFFFVSTKALFGLMMLATFIFCSFVRRASLLNVIGGLTLFCLVIGLFASTEFGQERLGSLAETPLLNPDINLWKAILTSQWDGNSFNWRLAQWHYLLQQWQNYPWLGYGLSVHKYVSTNSLEPHNDYIRALIDTGLIGFLTFVGFLMVQIVYLLYLAKMSFSNKVKQDFCFTLASIMISLAVGMITENIWSHTTMFFYWFTFLAIAGWDWEESQTI